MAVSKIEVSGYQFVNGLEIKNVVCRIFLHGAGDEHEISSSKYTCYFFNDLF
jgi:hypothetical protein